VTSAVVGIILGGVSGALLLCFGAFILYLRRKRAWKKKWVEEDLKRKEGEEESMIRGLEQAQVCHTP
jgi:hypothetical protein